MSGIGGFTDVPSGKFYSDAVQWAADNGVAVGTSNTTFSPDSPCSRCDLVTFMWNARMKPEPINKLDVFTDVPVKSYFNKAVIWACENGISPGHEIVKFHPKEALSRGLAITFMHRFAGVCENNFWIPPEASEGTSFEDVAEGQFYYDAVSWADEAGVTFGTSSTKFSPRKDCTRGEAITFLYLYMKNK